MKQLLFVLLILSSAHLAFPQAIPYKVVFDLTSRDSLDQKAVLRWINEITAVNPDAKLENRYVRQRI